MVRGGDETLGKLGLGTCTLQYQKVFKRLRQGMGLPPGNCKGYFVGTCSLETELGAVFSGYEHIREGLTLEVEKMVQVRSCRVDRGLLVWEKRFFYSPVEPPPLVPRFPRVVLLVKPCCVNGFLVYTAACFGGHACVRPCSRGGASCFFFLIFFFSCVRVSCRVLNASRFS